MKSIVLLEFACLCSLSLAQYYHDGHALMADGLGQGIGGGIGALHLSNYGAGAPNEDTIPISQDELAQLMAQSLASSPRNNHHNYNNQPQQGGYSHPAHQHSGHSQSDHSDDSNSPVSYEGGDDQSAHNPEEYSNEGHYTHRDVSGDPQQFQPHSQSDDSGYQHQPESAHNYRESDGGYENTRPYHQERSAYQSQYPNQENGAYAQHRQASLQDSQPNGYDHSQQSADGQYGSAGGYARNSPAYSAYNSQGADYEQSPPNTAYESSGAAPRAQQHYSPNEDSSAGYPAEYSSPSGSYLSYNVNHGPQDKYFEK